MRVRRNLEDKILKLLSQFPAVAILGARQTGKTELSRHLGRKWSYFDLERADDYDLISRDPRFFFSRYPDQLIIDEAQRYPELFNELRGVIDEDRAKKGRFLITGSSSPELVRQISETLPGRIATVELGTLRANEYYQQPLGEFFSIFEDRLCSDLLTSLKPAVSHEKLLQFWFTGGYPEPALSEEDRFWENWMLSYFDSYINRDLQALFPKLDKVRYRRFVQMLAHVSGCSLVKSDLAQSVEVSESTIKDYIEIADGTFVWRNLTSYEHNIRRQVFKMPRGHFRDSGLLHFLLKLRSFSDLERHPMLGRSFENFVIEEILKGLTASSVTGWSAHYYRTRARSEIDLILHGPFGVLPIEIKYGYRVRRDDYRTLQSFVREHQLPFGVLINNSEMVEWLAPEIIQIPANCL